MFDPNHAVTVKPTTMGKLMYVQMSAIDVAEFERGRRQWEDEKRRRANKARTAVLRYSETRKPRGRKATLRAIRDCCLADGSGSRLAVLLSLIGLAPAEIFWPALINEWTRCDAAWGHRTSLLEGMENTGTALPFFSRAQRQFFGTLPPQVQVYRGCSRTRVRAVAWTTDRSVAEGFARGHRGIRLPDPVVASAVIPKEHIFFVT